MQGAVRKLYEFGPFVLDPDERILRHGSARMELPPRAFDTLLVLVENQGRLLDKDALMKTVWGETVVEENNLSQAIYLLRKALRDGEGGIRYIETVPKRGYRFLVEVKPSAPVETEESQSAEPHPGQPITAAVSSNGHRTGTPSGAGVAKAPAGEIEQPSSKRAAESRSASQPIWPAWMQGLIGAMAVLVAFALLQALGWKQRVFGEASNGVIRSVAVLPLQNLSNDPNQEYFVDGMTDELITDLAQIRELKVVSKTSIMQYKGTRTPLPQIGRALGVDAVVEGSVLRSGDKVRITAQLIRTATDRHIWARAYDGDLKDVLSLQARVAEEITDQVKLNLSAEESGRLHRERPVDPEALDLYLRGRYAWNQRNMEGFGTAVEYFHRAIEKDANFALPYAGLADSYTLLALYGEGAAGIRDAKVIAQKALELDPELAEAHTSLAAVKILNDWDWVGAEKEFQRAIELNPNSAHAHHWYGNLLLSAQGRFDEANTELQRAKALDPASLIIRADIGFNFYLAGNYDLALKSFQEVETANPQFIPVHFYLSQYYRRVGNYDLWIKETVENDHLIGEIKTADALQRIYNRGGYRAVLEENAKPLNLPSELAGTARGTCTAAQANAMLGNNSAALDLLEQCYKMNADGLIYMKVDPVWDNLRHDPKFQQVSHRLNM